MKLGCCASLWEDMILKLPAAGADYAEAGFSSLMGKSLDQVRARAAQLEKAGVSLESMNVLFPGDIRLTGPQADFSAVDSYLEENLPKAQALGVKVVVFGSGGARRVPEGFPQEEAFAQLVELCREHIAPAAAAHGITCCVEPLNQKETNILTTSGECFRLVEAVNHPNLQLLVDLYHFDLEGESLSALEGWATATSPAPRTAAWCPSPGTARTTSPSSGPWRPWATRGASPWRATPGAACPRFAPRWRTCASSSARRPSKHREAAG